MMPSPVAPGDFAKIPSVNIFFLDTHLTTGAKCHIRCQWLALTNRGIKGPVKILKIEGQGEMRLREVMRGMLDMAILAVFIGLVALNSGFLPVGESQAEAAFGICRSNQCPQNCDVWVSVVGYIGNDTCNVAAPSTQWSGYCDGVCGICALSARCSGTTANTNIPCSCVMSGC